MEFISKLEKTTGQDISFGGGNLEPLNGVGRVGKGGIDKSFTLAQMLTLAHEINANIIIKAGPNAKWYLKRCNVEELHTKTETQKWRDTSRCTMWIVEW